MHRYVVTVVLDLTAFRDCRAVADALMAEQDVVTVNLEEGDTAGACRVDVAAPGSAEACASGALLVTEAGRAADLDLRIASTRAVGAAVAQR